MWKILKLVRSGRSLNLIHTTINTICGITLKLVILLRFYITSTQDSEKQIPFYEWYSEIFWFFRSVDCQQLIHPILDGRSCSLDYECLRRPLRNHRIYGDEHCSRYRFLPWLEGTQKKSRKLEYLLRKTPMFYFIICLATAVSSITGCYIGKTLSKKVEKRELFG